MHVIFKGPMAQLTVLLNRWAAWVDEAIHAQEGRVNGIGPVVDGNANLEISPDYINKIMEKSLAGSYTYNVEAGGELGDIFRVLNSSTSGDVTVTRGTLVEFYAGATNADVVVTPGTQKTFYRADGFERWIVV